MVDQLVYLVVTQRRQDDDWKMSGDVTCFLDYDEAKAHQDQESKRMAPTPSYRTVLFTCVSGCSVDINGVPVSDQASASWVAEKSATSQPQGTPWVGCVAPSATKFSVLV